MNQFPRDTQRLIAIETRFDGDGQNLATVMQCRSCGQCAVSAVRDAGTPAQIEALRAGGICEETLVVSGAAEYAASVVV